MAKPTEYLVDAPVIAAPFGLAVKFNLFGRDVCALAATIPPVAALLTTHKISCPK